jgi:RNA polymerase sigma factor (TIGR02999 family)
MPATQDPITRLLNEITAGQRSSDDLFPLIYAELRAAAEVQFANERQDHTLQPSALVHEAYLKLIGPRRIPWQNRSHFYTAAAEAMRRILIDHARAKATQKRAAPPRSHEYASLDELATASPQEVISFDDALRRLQTQKPQAATIVQLRFFSGLSIEQTAKALGVSTRTVDRSWKFARAWLLAQLNAPR